MKTDLKSKDKKLGKSIGMQIAARRKSLGLTQGELAEAVEIEQESMSRIETGMVVPSITRLVSLADALNCSIESLLRPASSRKQDQATVMEGYLEGMDEAERDFAVRVISEFAALIRSRKPKRGK